MTAEQKNKINVRRVTRAIFHWLFSVHLKISISVFFCENGEQWKSTTTSSIKQTQTHQPHWINKRENKLVFRFPFGCLQQHHHRHRKTIGASCHEKVYRTRLARFSQIQKTVHLCANRSRGWINDSSLANIVSGNRKRKWKTTHFQADDRFTVDCCQQ